MGPGVSRVEEMGTIPVLLNTPTVGFNPTTEFRLEGDVIDPEVSVPTAAAVGTETSGSITSPSSLNSVVGLKPTVGVLSRTGIVPISSTLDTPGPMTKNVTDNYILLKAMLGKDNSDASELSFPNIAFNRM